MNSMNSQRTTRIRLLILLFVVGSAFESAVSVYGAEPAKAERVTWRVRVDPIELATRRRDELPADVAIDLARDVPELAGRTLDLRTTRVRRVDAAGKLVAGDGPSATDATLPFRWYDAAIPYEFPEF